MTEMTKGGKVVVTILALIAGLIGLAMSLCGGAFTPMALTNIGRSNVTDTLSLLFLTLGSLVVGIAVMYSTYRILRGLRNQGQSDDVAKWGAIAFLILAGAGLLAMSICGGFR